jgi:hypothetical protein
MPPPPTKSDRPYRTSTPMVRLRAFGIFVSNGASAAHIAVDPTAIHVSSHCCRTEGAFVRGLSTEVLAPEPGRKVRETPLGQIDMPLDSRSAPGHHEAQAGFFASLLDDRRMPSNCGATATRMQCRGSPRPRCRANRAAKRRRHSERAQYCRAQSPMASWKKDGGPSSRRRDWRPRPVCLASRGRQRDESGTASLPSPITPPLRKSPFAHSKPGTFLGFAGHPGQAIRTLPAGSASRVPIVCGRGCSSAAAATDHRVATAALEVLTQS